jgi:hypothetical protein
MFRCRRRRRRRHLSKSAPIFVRASHVWFVLLKEGIKVVLTKQLHQMHYIRILCSAKTATATILNHDREGETHPRCMHAWRWKRESHYFKDFCMMMSGEMMASEYCTVM